MQSKFTIQEQSESEEENLYKQYVEKARDRCNEYNLNHGRSLNRLALNALNAVNVISQDGDVSKVAYVWGSKPGGGIKTVLRSRSWPKIKDLLEVKHVLGST